jgi:hypothetical protein
MSLKSAKIFQNAVGFYTGTKKIVSREEKYPTL